VLETARRVRTLAADLLEIFVELYGRNF
jgi:hypothetical protein